MSTTLELAKSLISKASVTPDDCGCQAIMIDRLKKIGFEIHPLKFGDVDNFWAVHGNRGPLFAFAGHTDVVPAGDENAWNTKPFEPTIKDGFLYGRGAADMKGGLASMVTATEDFIKDNPNHNGRIAFLITSDEEGVAVNGTVKVMEYLTENNQKIDYCLLGEPSSTSITGDVIKNGRRGSLNGVMKVHGKQGHVAYPHLAKNPIHHVSPALNDLCKQEWDNGNDYFPATSFQISNMHSGDGVTNVIPGDATVMFNFRYSTETTKKELQKKVHEILDSHNLDYSIEWSHSGYPFLTPQGELVSACIEAIKKTKGIEPELSTSGGTSDGRFIAQEGTQVIELGPVNATIHQVNESVLVQDLDDLSEIYYQVLTNICS
ncbi:MAG: succinyl-diaminopimelate desuccinylase [Thiotrichales bacterium]|jgi:succinyl-diaminopimelate desuccinylase|nr:succinyl-diaminopimelate desuccinylase [Thiotrichales bacterium]MBT5984416.1 succinyl-diaminopimelate desuccinylase [Thiotrichales bacterium]MBT6771927.1 succinyl-diaminopimelate desuccinylase [Thiotrichales bacterium]MBT7149509.1 succinyl-diaminopimelate desuccinylase [Thiotrichales bacterium]MBT7438752.1 succinyl-diaminopimelate desuccinylase [Thiotrichales bacterium]